MASENHCQPESSTRAAAAALILMKGHPGSGKSTLARALAHSMRCPLVDKDDARDCFHAYASAAAAPAAAAAGDVGCGINWNQLAYEVMFQATQLRVGLHVVLDCPLSRRHLYDRALALAHRYGARVVVVECWCSDETIWKERLERRAQEDAAAAAAAAAVAAGTEAASEASAAAAAAVGPGTGAAGAAEGKREGHIPQAHKPRSWEQLQELLGRYQGCWRWSTDGSVDVANLIRVDTAEARAADVQQLAHSIVQQLEQRLGCCLRSGPHWGAA